MSVSSHRLGWYVSILYRYSQSFFNAKLKQYNLGSGQYMFLLTILQQEGINQEQLAQAVHIDKATTARAVAKLISTGYVTKDVCSTDKRAYMLYPTEKAHDIHERLKCILDEWNELILNDFSSEDITKFTNLLSHARQNILNSNLKNI